MGYISKRIVAIILAGLMLLSIASCESTEETQESSIIITETTVEETTVETTVKTLNVGDIVTLGRFEGKEITWIVLAAQGDKYLVVSTNKVGEVSYNSEQADVNWSTCSLRKWLNSEFYNGTFTVSERENIQMSIVPAAKTTNKRYNIGSDTEDYIFLLSEEEFEEYLKPIQSGHNLDTCLFMLRTAGPTGDTITCVNFLEIVDPEEVEPMTVDRTYDLVPAMWIKAF